MTTEITQLKYSKEHEWVNVQGNQAYVGITAFAQAQLGDIVFVELPAEGVEVRAGEVFGTIESVKTVSDLYSPVTGKIVEVNHKLQDVPETVNANPYNDGWMILVEISDSAELDELLSFSAYQDLISEE